MANMKEIDPFPKRIVCLTEESVETLFLLGEEKRIVGVSQFVVRPKEATKIKKVSSFIKANYDKILELKPDLVLGYSDIQKQIAHDLIEKGLNVFISNHRTIPEILNYIQVLGGMVGAQQKAQALVNELSTKIESYKSKKYTNRPKVYFEEWDDPGISGIKWVSELIEIAGGDDIYKDQSSGILAKDRFVNHKDIILKNPDVILACWCGKKVQIDSIRQRNNWENINAVKNNKIFELDPAIFLQPGPAPLLEGIEIISKLLTCK
jgi:iron complex transport system substrate-binding protein